MKSDPPFAKQNRKRGRPPESFRFGSCATRHPWMSCYDYLRDMLARRSYLKDFHAGDFLTLRRDEFRVTLHRVCSLLCARRILFDWHILTSVKRGA